LFTEKALRRHIGASHIFQRGKGYANDTNIEGFSVNKDSEKECTLSANVIGSEEYWTELVFDPRNGKIIESDCDCPYYDTCKHIAALGLYALKKDREGALFSDAPSGFLTENLSSKEEESIFSSFEYTPFLPDFHEEESFSDTEIPELRAKVAGGRIILFRPEHGGISREIVDLMPPGKRFFLKSLFPPGMKAISELTIPTEMTEDFLEMISEFHFLRSENGEAYSLSRNTAPLTFFAQYKDNITISTSQKEIVLGNKKAWLLKESEFFPVPRSIPIPFLTLMAKTGKWALSPFYAEPVRQMIGRLKAAGLHVEEEGELRGPKIYSSQDAEVGILLFQIA
jgi:hypothetical protein